MTYLYSIFIDSFEPYIVAFQIGYQLLKAAYCYKRRQFACRKPRMPENEGELEYSEPCENGWTRYRNLFSSLLLISLRVWTEILINYNF